MESDIKDAAIYILNKGIKEASVDSLQDQVMAGKLKKIDADQFEVIVHDDRSFGKPNEPIDSIVQFTRIRKSSSVSWGAEDIIYIYSKSAKTYPDYSEPDGYFFRKINDKIYYRRYFFSTT